MQHLFIMPFFFSGISILSWTMPRKVRFGDFSWKFSKKPICSIYWIFTCIYYTIKPLCMDLRSPICWSTTTLHSFISQTLCFYRVPNAILASNCLHHWFLWPWPKDQVASMWPGKKHGWKDGRLSWDGWDESLMNPVRGVLKRWRFCCGSNTH